MSELPKAILTRQVSEDAGTFGLLSFDSFVLRSGELPDKNNAPDLSCIPAGVYLVDWTYSPRFGRDTYEVVGVHNRTAIRIHPANWMGDKTKGMKCELDGCIALGLSVGFLDGQKALEQSKVATDQLEQHFGHEPFELEIRSPT